MEHHYERLTKKPFEPALQWPAGERQAGLWFVFRGNRLLVEQHAEQNALPQWREPEEHTVVLRQRHYLGRLNGSHCWAGEVEEEADAPPGMTYANLRRLYGTMDEDFFWVAARAVQIVDWERTNQYCGRCGSPTTRKQDERVRLCANCGLPAYPRLAPAVIVAVTWENKILLARSQRHPAGLFSVLAGFVEPGETLEQCVLREVKEETGLDVVDIHYFGSQPWPFPHSLMIAFTCRSTSGEIRLLDDELVEAAWFTAHDLPNVPPPLTISRHLIDWFVEQADG